MTRIVARCALRLLAMVLFSACSTTTQRDFSVITLCVASLTVGATIAVAA